MIEINIFAYFIGGKTLNLATDNWVYVSETLAELYNSKRFVHNGIDPSEFIYSDTKDDYFFFLVGGVKRAYHKGLDIALSLAQKTGIKLLIAGTSDNSEELAAFKAECVKHNAEYVGPVYGQRKAELFAGAKAVLFPSRFNEACPLIIAEALMSGTPVIASNNGAIPELLPANVGFACANEAEYLAAIENIDSIQPQDCWNLAMQKFHYLDMAKGYVKQYEEEIATERLKNNSQATF